MCADASVVNVHDHLCHRDDTSPVNTSTHSALPVNRYAYVQRQKKRKVPLWRRTVSGMSSLPVPAGLVSYHRAHQSALHLCAFMTLHLPHVEATFRQSARKISDRECVSLAPCATGSDRADRCAVLPRHTFRFRTCTFLSLFAYKQTKMKVDQNCWYNRWYNTSKWANNPNRTNVRCRHRNNAIAVESNLIADCWN